MADNADKTFLLPDLGEGLTEGEVVRWLVGLGVQREDRARIRAGDLH
jgi:hypothetical protein